MPVGIQFPAIGHMQADSITLLEFLEQTGAQVRAYDIGRRIGTLGREQFLAFEKANAPYPLPMQRKAWFALVQLPAADTMPTR